jgi:hypothetical protein
MALRMGDWKLLLNPNEQIAEEPAPSGGKVTNRVELYNLADDIGESKNLAAAQPEKVQELRTRLAAFLKDAVPPGQKDAPSQAPAQKAVGRKKGAKKQ